MGYDCHGQASSCKYHYSVTPLAGLRDECPQAEICSDRVVSQYAAKVTLP